MIRRDDHGPVAVLTLEHGKANAFDLELLEALEEAAAGLSDAAAAVVTGSGRIFSAGVDLKRFLDAGDAYRAGFIDAFARAFRTFAALEIPVIAAINGHAIAGGAVLAAAADLRLMAEGKGRIGVPELLVGVPFPAVALETVRFAWPAAPLAQLAFEGRTLLPDEALAAGLVDAVLPAEGLLARSLERAQAIAARDRESVRLTKRQLRAPLLERVDRWHASHGDEVRRIWADPATCDRIRGYLEQTLGR